MNDNGIVFNQNAQKIAFDDEHYEMMMTRYEQFMQNVENCTNYYSDLELEKQRMKSYKESLIKDILERSNKHSLEDFQRMTVRSLERIFDYV